MQRNAEEWKINLKNLKAKGKFVAQKLSGGGRRVQAKQPDDIKWVMHTA